MSESKTNRLGSIEQAMLGAPEFTPVDVARQAGVPLEQARRLWRALGFPPVPDDQVFFTRSDVQMLTSARDLSAQRGGDPEVLHQLTRVTGQSLARVAATLVAAVSDRAEGDACHTPDEAAVQLLTTLESSVPDLQPFLDYTWRRHLLAAVRRAAAVHKGVASEGNLLAVGFADLVGFTAVSQELNDHELAALVNRFEEQAYDHIPQGGGRVIKMIGDEVMFAAEDIEDAGRIALDLIATYADDPTTPDIRVGLAFGPTLSWQGDLFGPTVNLASRLVNIARPGSALVSEEIFERLQQSPSFVLRRLRRTKLKGIGRVGVAVLRRLSGDEGAGTDVASDAEAADGSRRRAAVPKTKFAKKRDAFRQKVQERLDGQLERLTELKARAQDLTADLDEETEEQIELLQAKADALLDKLDQLGDAGEEAWETIKENVEAAWDDLSDSLSSAWKKARRRKPTPPG